MQAALECVGLADQRSELQVLVRQFGEFDAPIAPLELLTERRYLDRAEDVNAALLPRAIQRSEPCRAELSAGCRQVPIGVWRWADQLALPRAKVPVSCSRLAASAAS